MTREAPRKGIEELGITHDRRRRSTKDELEFVRRELREAIDRQAATNEILHLISNSPSDTQPVFDAIVQSGSKLFPGAAISVALPIGDKVEAVAVADEDPIRAEAWRGRFPFPLTREYMHGVAILEARVVDIPDVANAPNKDSAGAQNFLASGYRAVTLTPLLRDGKAIGVLGIVRLSPGPLSDEQLTVLQTFAAQAVIAIENTNLVNELRQSNAIVEQVSRQLAKYISPQLYQSIITGEQDVTIESTRKKLTIFFSDIVGFTQITDRLESEELTGLLNQYLTAMSGIAEGHGATFDKFIGDAIMCFFGDPESRGVKGDADACVRMALEMRKRLFQLQVGWQEKGLIDCPFEARMGINTGYCTVGNFGSQDRMDYTIIGHEVNLAARLESHAEAGGILMAAETYSLVKDWLLADEQEAITMKGFAQPIRTFRVRGTFEDLARDENLFVHLDDGVRISIQGDVANKKKTKAALKRALAQLDK
jgi:class 3 adenylate cyclase